MKLHYFIARMWYPLHLNYVLCKRMESKLKIKDKMKKEISGFASFPISNIYFNSCKNNGLDPD